MSITDEYLSQFTSLQRQMQEEQLPSTGLTPYGKYTAHHRLCVSGCAQCIAGQWLASMDPSAFEKTLKCRLVAVAGRSHSFPQVIGMK